jgi:type III pantothenate kinase
MGESSDSISNAAWWSKIACMQARQGSVNLMAVDIGNSRIKIGQFPGECAADKAAPRHVSSTDNRLLPEPVATFDLAISSERGLFDAACLTAWCEEHRSESVMWFVASVHRAAAARLTTTLQDWAKQAKDEWPIKFLTYRDVPLTIRVKEPERVGIDRLLGAVAANRLRAAGRQAVVVDLGTATTVDLLDADGAFAGGAILPGISMSARALNEYTDALPHVAMETLDQQPAALGKSTEAAIQAGLYWGAVGAIRELVSRLSAQLPQQPQVFVTGGASQQVAETLAQDWPVQHVPHLVLAGIAILAAETPGRAGG